MPQEWEYADDVGFADEECEPLDSLLQIACTHLREWNLLVNESKTEFTHIYLRLQKWVIKVHSPEATRHGTAVSHWDPCSAAPMTSCIVVCLATCHSALFGWYGCVDLRSHCKSDFKCTMLCVYPPCCITVAAGLHRRPFWTNLLPATEVICAPSSAPIGHTALSTMRHSRSDAIPDHHLRQW